MRTGIRIARHSLTVSTAAGVMGALGAVAVVAALGLQISVVGLVSVAVAVACGSGLSAWMLRVAGRRPLAPVESLATGLADGRAEPAAYSPDAFGDLLLELLALRCSLDESVEAHRKARRAAEQTEAIETEFLTTVSHELRTPLNAILGFAQILLDEIDGPLTTSHQEDVETILASGSILRDLVAEVLDLAAMHSGRFALKCERVDPGPIAHEVARLLNGQLGAKKVSIETRLAADLPQVTADPRRLRQVLTNLGTNALKFTERGSVVFEIAPSGSDAVRFTVRDSGSGIARTELAMIFEEFTQVGDIRRASQGSGLGLAICKRLVALHDGRIEVESVVNEGSSFHVYLPRATESA